MNLMIRRIVGGNHERNISDRGKCKKTRPILPGGLMFDSCV